jgi:hypothetical protein
MSSATPDLARLSDVDELRGPYPGLRPFEQHEWPIFFGREAMTDDVIERLGNKCLLLIHGSSGAGKSSLLRAGVLPRLERQQRRHGLQWRTATMRPGNAPLWNLARAIAGLRASGPTPEQIDAVRLAFDQPNAHLITIIESHLQRGTQRLCLLVDQFEELFQYAQEGSPDETALFVELVTGTLDSEPAAPVRTLLAMRSEYLGECARLPGLARAVNEAQYLVPRMPPEALRRAIQRPAELFGGEVSVALAGRLIDDAAGDQDELPLIQHGLMRLWDLAAGSTMRPLRLELGLYETFGPLNRLLDEHANDVLAEAAPTADDGRVAAEVFRALTDTNAEGQAIRRPQNVASLAEIAGVSGERIKAILDPFRAPGAWFVTPYRPTVVKDEDRIDLGHEALIRCWRQLSAPETGWQACELRDGLVWRSLLTQAESFDRDPQSLLSVATTRERVRWCRQRTRGWAARYGNRWDAVGSLIRASRIAALQQRRVERDRNKSAQAEEKRARELAERQALAERKARGSALAAGIWSDLDFRPGVLSLTVRQRNAL